MLPAPCRRRGKRLTHDLEYRIELGFCVESGIPRSAFLGRPQLSGEAAWLDRDRDEVVGYLLWLERTKAQAEAAEAKLCPECKTDPTDWPVGYAGEPKWDVDITECRGCRTAAEAWASLAGHDVDPTAGLHVRFVPFDPTAGGIDSHIELVNQRRLDAEQRRREQSELDESKLQGAVW